MEKNQDITKGFHQLADVPEIYNIIKDGSTNEIGSYMYKDYYSGDRDTERTFLAIKELQDRGYEGMAALKQVSYGTDELSQKISEILNIENIKDDQIENILGIKRFGKILKMGEDISTAGYEYLKSKNKFSGNHKDFHLKLLDDIEKQKNEHSYIIGSLEKFTMANAVTFASLEPDYLELWGPKELLRLRTSSHQDMLLLGSLGFYSAREFRKFADKITPDAKTMVIDIGDIQIKLMNSDKNSKNVIIQGDVTNMPIKDESMDQVYTNYLFHVLATKRNIEKKEGVAKTINEAARVLRKGGSFIIAERSFGRYELKEDLDQMLYDVMLICKKAGLKPIVSSTKSKGYFFRDEVGSATIDLNGFPHYEDSLIITDLSDSIRARFVKI